MADFDDRAGDGAEAQRAGSAWTGGAAGGTPVVNGGLLDPRTFPSSWNRLATAGPSLERPDPQITGPLRTDAGSEVLQDILNAQAKLNGQARTHLAPHPETWSVNGRTYYAIGARGFDPTQSNGLTVMPTPAQDAAAWAGLTQVSTPSGEQERGGSILPVAPTAARIDPISGLLTKLRFQPVVLRAPGGKAGGDNQSRTLEIPRVDGVSPLIHSHIDSGEYQSDGMVDEPSANGGPGDASALLDPSPVPMATVSHGQVGWHVLDDGQLKFRYPVGSMTPFQIGEMQDNLNQQQSLLQRRK